MPGSAAKPEKYKSARVVIFEDSLRSAQLLSAELQKWEITSEICQSLPKLREIVINLSSAIFVIDIDMGTKRHEEGIAAIRFLRKTENESRSPFYIAVLTSHDEFRLKATAAGANAFLEKTSIQTDALELAWRVQNLAPDTPQTLLAIREYENLARQLKTVKKSPGLIDTAIKTVQRALSWPFLMSNEKLILTALYTQLRADSDPGLDKRTIDVCLEGVNMLTTDRARNSSVEKWLEKARRHSANFTLSWLDEDFFDEQEG